MKSRGRREYDAAVEKLSAAIEKRKQLTTPSPIKEEAEPFDIALCRFARLAVLKYVDAWDDIHKLDLIELKQLTTLLETALVLISASRYADAKKYVSAVQGKLGVARGLKEGKSLHELLDIASAG